MMRLPSTLPLIGANGTHRSGWPYAVESLKPYLSENGMLIDDFVERTFLYKMMKRPVWTEPWIGVFHHPPKMPGWFLPHARIQNLLKVQEFVDSWKYLQGAVVLSQHVAEWVIKTLQVPTLVVKHPTEIPEQQFDLQAYLASPTLVHVGWYLRNQDAIAQVPVPPWITKIRLVAGSNGAKEALLRLRREGPYKGRAKLGRTKEIDFLPADQYDALLARSVVFGEYIDCSASNTVIEAMARCTPLIVNRHPALIEYLGAAYPLFYDELEDVPNLLRPTMIRKAHDYLRSVDRSWMAGESFASQVAAFAETVRVPPYEQSAESTSEHSGDASEQLEHVG